MNSLIPGNEEPAFLDGWFQALYAIKEALKQPNVSLETLWADVLDARQEIYNIRCDMKNEKRVLLWE